MLASAGIGFMAMERSSSKWWGPYPREASWSLEPCVQLSCVLGGLPAEGGPAAGPSMVRDESAAALAESNGSLDGSPGAAQEAQPQANGPLANGGDRKLTAAEREREKRRKAVLRKKQKKASRQAERCASCGRAGSAPSNKWQSGADRRLATAGGRAGRCAKPAARLRLHAAAAPA